MAIRNVLRLLALVSLACGVLRAQVVPDSPSTLLASLDTHASALRPFDNSAVPSLMPQALPRAPYVSSRTCAAHVASREECRVDWNSLFVASFNFLTVQHLANFASSAAARHNLTHGPFFDDWASSISASGTAASLSHPMTGAVAAYLFLQNDPRARDLAFPNRRSYWTSRLEALAFSAAYSAQWEMGPFSRASLANQRTPASTLVLAPLAGTAWSMGEDLVDRELIWRLEGRTNRKPALLAMSLLNPARGVANLMRGRAPWYRDSRETRIARGELPFHNVSLPAAAGQ